MPILTAPRPPQAAGMPPPAIGPDSEKIALYGMQSSERFYGASAAIGSFYYYTPPLALDLRRLVAPLEPTIAGLRGLLDRREGWNGYDAAAPDPDAVTQACDWITRLFVMTVVTGLPLIAPNVTAGPDGEVVFDWWRGDKSLTVYVEAQDTQFLRATGSEPGAEMVDGSAESVDTCISLWSWLTT